jgi:membrane-anchored protein YejM (alkaline phosphatase superfamily)
MQEKKMRRKKIFFGMIFANVKMAWCLAQDLQWLPFWQFAAKICHYGGLYAIMSADRIGWYSYPLYLGG